MVDTTCKTTYTSERACPWTMDTLPYGLQPPIRAQAAVPNPPYRSGRSSRGLSSRRLGLDGRFPPLFPPYMPRATDHTMTRQRPRCKARKLDALAVWEYAIRLYKNMQTCTKRHANTFTRKLKLKAVGTQASRIVNLRNRGCCSLVERYTSVTYREPA